VNTDTVKQIIREGSSYKPHGASGKQPVVVRSGGKNYLMDGHNRVVAAMFRGQKEMPMLFIEKED
jgi:hypothetical protein